MCYVRDACTVTGIKTSDIVMSSPHMTPHLAPVATRVHA